MESATNTKQEKNVYFCNTCQKRTELSITSNIVCKNCNGRIFRKDLTKAIIRVKAV